MRKRSLWVCIPPDMGWLSLFSVEVLDTRLGPPDDVKKRTRIIEKAGPSRWNTIEFYLYGVVFAIAVPMMVWAAVSASSTSNPNYSKYSHLLSKGWILGRQVDNSDLQYSSFRNFFLYLLACIMGHAMLRRVSLAASIDRISFDAVFACVFLLALHGVGFFKMLLLLYVNFRISRIPNKRVAYALTWVFGVGSLFANELFQGYPLGKIHPILDPLESIFTGLMPRWEVHFNFTMLRMVSFNVDYIRAKANAGAEKVPNVEILRSNERLRIDTSKPLQEYSFLNYFAYTCYSPLYIAGPVLTFNDYIFQSRHRLTSITNKSIALYALRFGICLLTMELLLHFTYVVAISQTRAWNGNSPFQISMVALFNLNIIWLKLLLPWRFFRLWALIDGIDAPENMVRCVNDNYSALSFWRSWHRSYNRWVTRYIYIPLGGSSRALVNSLVVFTFVAIWHDIQLHLLIWGWLVVIFIMPEVIAGLLFPASKWQAQRPTMYRHLCAVGAVANIWMMMIANLVGFCVGVDGIKQMLHDMIATADGLKYIIASSICLFVGAQAMFEFREREKRKGIDLRC